MGAEISKPLSLGGSVGDRRNMADSSDESRTNNPTLLEIPARARTAIARAGQNCPFR